MCLKTSNGINVETKFDRQQTLAVIKHHSFLKPSNRIYKVKVYSVGKKHVRQMQISQISEKCIWLFELNLR